MVLISLTHSGIQNCLDKLNDVCTKWGLGINVNKSKCMVMSKGVCKSLPLKVNTEELEFVTEYKYLGFKLSRTGKVKSVIDDKSNKSN